MKKSRSITSIIESFLNGMDNSNYVDFSTDGYDLRSETYPLASLANEEGGPRVHVYRLEGGEPACVVRHFKTLLEVLEDKGIAYTIIENPSMPLIRKQSGLSK